jgi:hypothetical protein
LRPGRLIQIDLRDEWMEQDEALTLFALLTSVLVLHPDQNETSPFRILLAYDEAHKFARNKAIREQMYTIAAERRHLNVSLVISSQDPLSVPEEILPLLDGIGVFQHQSPKWNKRLADVNAAFQVLTTQMTSLLRPGLMWFWAKDWAMTNFEEDGVTFAGRPVLMETRPRAALHGGATLPAGPEVHAQPQEQDQNQEEEEADFE